MLGVFWAVVTVLAWGSWLDTSQNVPMKTQAATLTLIGILIATIGGIVLGNLKS